MMCKTKKGIVDTERTYHLGRNLGKRSKRRIALKSKLTGKPRSGELAHISTIRDIVISTECRHR